MIQKNENEVHLHTGVHYSALKGIMNNEVKWMERKNIIVIEGIQTQKDKWTLTIKYRLPMIHSIDPELNKKEDS